MTQRGDKLVPLDVRLASIERQLVRLWLLVAFLGLLTMIGDPALAGPLSSVVRAVLGIA